MNTSEIIKQAKMELADVAKALELLKAGISRIGGKNA